MYFQTRLSYTLLIKQNKHHYLPTTHLTQFEVTVIKILNNAFLTCSWKHWNNLRVGKNNNRALQVSRLDFQILVSVLFERRCRKITHVLTIALSIINGRLSFRNLFFQKYFGVFQLVNPKRLKKKTVRNIFLSVTRG